MRLNQLGKINVLSFEIANLIAAGEVVERPSSVVKELIENSIDSGATEIIAEIKRGGVGLIRVSDNGCGISREDLPVSIKRHATSKISDRDDLAAIMTLGFRGEALAAISSVCDMTIITKTKDEEFGSMMNSEAGRVTDISEVCCADGTTVIVNNLFYNVPARRKFLKKDATEAMNVCALVEKVALSRPDISIQMKVDGEERFKTLGNGKLIDTVYAVFGKDFSQKLIAVDGTANGVRCHGFVGRSDNVKKNRNYMNVFINGRYVKSVTAQTAVERAFTSYIAPECFPTCVLFLEMHSSSVDVNVHPAKLECKFSDEKAVFETVYYSVKSAIEKHEYRPEMELKSKPASNPWVNQASAFVPVGEKPKAKQLTFDAPAQRPARTDTIKSDYFKAASEYRVEDHLIKNDDSFGIKKRAGFKDEPPMFSTITPKQSVDLLDKYKNFRIEDDSPAADNSSAERGKSEPVSEQNYEETRPYRIIGEAFDCYVIVECEKELLLIDKHAAHERVIFEDLKKQLAKDERVIGQVLLLPVFVELTPDEISAAGELKDELYKVGFEFDLASRGANLTVIPNVISSFDAESLFVKMLDDATEARGDSISLNNIAKERSLYQIACKAAIKGGRRYDKAVTEWLVEKLMALPDITVCPHGRPVAYKLTKNELDRQFDRLK